MHVTLMSGGFPCQDISVAGKQEGIHGSRSGLVFEQLRLLGDIEPDYAVFENVANFRNKGLKEVLGEIAEIGYDAEWYSIRAFEITGGLHERERTFIIAHKPECIEQPRCTRSGKWGMDSENQQGTGQNPNEYLPGLQRQHKKESCSGESEKSVGLRDADTWLEVATTLCRVDGRVPHRVDRIIALGNCVVPQQVYPILKAIADIERGKIE
jgi:DNA (cytosine-5)-methyltransferase 1